MEIHPTIQAWQAAGPAQTAFPERAAAATFQHFGRRGFVRGVVGISKFRRENCVDGKRERFIMDEARVPAAIAAGGLEASPHRRADCFAQTTAAPAAVLP